MSEGSIAVPVAAELTADEKACAGLAHAMMISTWWIGPPIIYLTKRKSRSVSFHALQALPWQIIFTLLCTACMAVFFAVMFGTLSSLPQQKSTEPPQFPAGFFFVFPPFWPVGMGVFAISMILGIIYCLKALCGEWAGYPVIGRSAGRIIGA